MSDEHLTHKSRTVQILVNAAATRPFGNFANPESHRSAQYDTETEAVKVKRPVLMPNFLRVEVKEEAVRSRSSAAHASAGRGREAASRAP
eukprot:6076355-Pleurochrysis_carterae.AAC.1